MEVIIEGAIANFSGLSNEQFLQSLNKNTAGFEFYQLVRRPGYITNAAFDWKAIGNISSVVGIISFIWLIYEKNIEPSKPNNSNAGIIIRIENSGNQNNFWIGNEIKSKEDLLKKIEIELKQIQPDVKLIQEKIDSIKNSPMWKQVK